MGTPLFCVLSKTRVPKIPNSWHYIKWLSHTQPGKWCPPGQSFSASGLLADILDQRGGTSTPASPIRIAKKLSVTPKSPLEGKAAPVVGINKPGSPSLDRPSMPPTVLPQLLPSQSLPDVPTFRAALCFNLLTLRWPSSTFTRNSPTCHMSSLCQPCLQLLAHFHFSSIKSQRASTATQYATLTIKA